MRKAVAALAAVAAAGALAGTAIGDGSLRAKHAGAPAQATSGDSARALAARATGRWTGEFKPPNQQGSSVLLKAAVRGGEATSVKRFRYLARMQCAKSGPTPGNAGWVFSGGINVKPNRRFSLAGRSADTPRSTFRIKGRFSKTFRSVRGTFSTHQWFPADPGQGLPAEYCNLAKTSFRARR
jgi:hypothetical protein